MIWDKLIETYDKNIDRCKDIAPIAHTKIKAHIGIVIDSAGIFRMAAEINGITTIIPCTAESESRTSNIAPHPIHDNLSYVGILDEYEKRHDAYMHQLYEYACHENVRYAKAVYNYLKHGKIMNDIDYILKTKRSKDIKSMNVVFAVYGLKEDTRDDIWTQYYLSKIPQNGICMATGKPDYIPKSHPAGIRHSRDLSKLIITEPNEKTDRGRWNNSFLMGYIASQKCLHTLQALLEEDKSYVTGENAKLSNIRFNTISFVDEMPND